MYKIVIINLIVLKAHMDISFILLFYNVVLIQMSPSILKHNTYITINIFIHWDNFRKVGCCIKFSRAYWNCVWTCSNLIVFVVNLDTMISFILYKTWIMKYKDVEFSDTKHNILGMCL